MILSIPQKYLIRLERYTKFGYAGSFDPWAVRYVFSLPKSVGVPDGYTIYIDANGVEWEHNERGLRFNDSKPLTTDEIRNGAVKIDCDEDEVYSAKMTECREEGKRYKQYKYTAKELYNIYNVSDLSDSETVVAKVLIYSPSKDARVINELYVVGVVKGCWFYSTELYTKRRLGTKGLQILGKIKFEDTKAVTKLIEDRGVRYASLYNQYEGINHNIWLTKECILKYASEIASVEESIDAEFRAIITSAEKALSLLRAKFEGYDRAKEKIAADFETALSQYFLKN